MKFPMTLTHRANPLAQIVVANAEQLAEVPAEFQPLTTGGSADIITLAASAIPGVNLEGGIVSAAPGEDVERRQSLDEAVDEFTAHVQAEEGRLAAARAQLEQDRDDLKAQQEALARDRADFEAQRATTTAGTGDIAGDTGAAAPAAEGEGTGDIATPPAAPAKRTRAAAAKEGA